MPSQGCNWYYHECVVGGGGQWGWLRDNGLGWWGYNGDEWSPLLIPIVSLLPQDHSSSPSWEGGVEGRQQGWVILIVPPFPPSLGGTFPPTPTLIRQGNGENSLIFPHCLIGVGSGKNRENSHWVRVFLILSWGWGGGNGENSLMSFYHFPHTSHPHEMRVWRGERGWGGNKI